MRRHIERMNGNKLVIAFIVALALVYGAFLIRARQTAQADLHICHAQQQDRNVLRSILVLARAKERHSRTTTPEQRRESEAFYAAVLGDKTHPGLVPPIDCKALPSLNPLP